MLEIFVDADGCPVKQEVYRVATRYGLRVYVVSNSALRVPDHPRVERIVVSGRFDAADDWIAGHAGQDDVVISGDIPLAARCLKSGARVLGPRGRPFSDETIHDALATRELFDALRQMDLNAGGPPPLTRKDRSRFLSQLDEIVQALRRQKSSPAPP